MDIWIFIAAAGSGYLAQFWQSSRNCKGVSGGITHDDDDECSGSPRHTSITKKRDYVPSSKRRSAKRRFRHGLRVNEGEGTVLGGRLTTNFHNPLLDYSEGLGLLALHNEVEEDACSCPCTWEESQRSHDTAVFYSTGGSNTLPRRAVGSFNDLWPHKCCDFFPDGYEASFKRTSAFPDDCVSYMSNLFSKNCLDPCGLSEVHGCCSNRRVKDKQESTRTNVAQALSSNRIGITGCHDQFEDVCTEGLVDAHIMPNCEVESSKKIRSLYDNERGGTFTKRRRSLAHHRPILCPSRRDISAQVGIDCREEIISGYKQCSLDQVAPLCQHGVQSCISDLNAVSSYQLVSDEISNFTSSRKVSLLNLDNINLPNLMGKRKEDASLESDLPSCCKEGSKEARGDGLCADGFWSKGNHLAKMLLFNFGVGVGMMFAIMSSKDISQQMILELEEVMSALKSLEGEIQAFRKLRLELDDSGNVRENILPEQSLSRVSLVMNTGSASKTYCDCSQERARIEAELEAELQRMEVHLNFKDNEFCGHNEDGLGVGNNAEGELSRQRIHGDNDVHLPSAETNILAHDVMHYRNCAVPPLELAKRLYEVLETRQEEKIIELEAEIKRLDNGLQAKEQQYQAWKQLVRHFLQGKGLHLVFEGPQFKMVIGAATFHAQEGANFIVYGEFHALDEACVNLSGCDRDTSAKDLPSTTSTDNLVVAGLEGSVPFLINNEDVSLDPVDNALSMYRSIPKLRKCSDGETREVWLHPLNNTGGGSPRQLPNEDVSLDPVDNALSMYRSIPKVRECSDGETCEVWRHPLNNTGSGSPRQLPNGLLKDANKRDLRSTETTIEPEVMEVSYGSVSSCSSNNAAVDIVGSASCSITSVDTAQERFSNQFKSDAEMKLSNQQEFFSLEWNRDPDPFWLSEEIFAQDVVVTDHSHGKCGQILECKLSEDSCNSSDIDEQLGQKLIERIVQKGRKGVLIVEAAKSILATFDLDNTSLDRGIPSC